MQQQQQSVNKCGFCEKSGHNISKCCDPNAVSVRTEFHASLSDFNGVPFILLDWLNMAKLNVVKLLAHRYNVSRTGTKHTIIASILDLHFPSYPNPIWRHPPHQTGQLFAIICSKTNQILSYQRRLIDVGVITEGVYDMNYLHTLDTMSLESLFHEFLRTNHQRYTDCLNNNNNNNIKSFIREPKEEKDKEEEQIDDVEDDCPICYEKVTCANEIELGCGHRFCNNCIFATLTRKIPTCALCRTKYRSLAVRSSNLYELIQPYLA